MKKLISATAFAILLGVTPAMACENGPDTGACGGLKPVIDKVLPPAAVAGMFLLHAYMIWAMENKVNIGQTAGQKAEADAASAVMNRYQTKPAYLAVAINGVPTLNAK